MKEQELPPEGGSHEHRDGSHEALIAGLRAVAEADERLGTSNAVGLRLLAEVQAIANARRRRAIAVSLSAAAALLVAISVPAWRSLQAPATGPSPATPVVTRELVTEFFPLTYSNVPARGGYVVRMQVSPEALASFGATAFASDHASTSLLADVVVGDDGLARAVRFVRVVNKDFKEQTP
jgi:hypothetical protein